MYNLLLSQFVKRKEAYHDNVFLNVAFKKSRDKKMIERTYSTNNININTILENELLKNNIDDYIKKIYNEIENELAASTKKEVV